MLVQSSAQLMINATYVSRMIKLADCAMKQMLLSHAPG